MLIDKIVLQKLENPVWAALTETHQKFAIDYKGVQFYNPEICPFGGFIDISQTQEAIKKYATLTNNLYIVGEKPIVDESIILNIHVPCHQMIIDRLNEPEFTEAIIPLNESHIDALYELVWLVMPGYYKKRTFEMGNYFGIFKNGQLVAATGERLQGDAFIEISAVVTHPNHTGNGYAKQLVTHTTKNIIQQHKVPILHVAENNIGAIKLYKKLGFKTIRRMTWWNFIPKIN